MNSSLVRGSLFKIFLRIAGPFAAVLPVAIGLVQFRDSQQDKFESDTKSEYVHATQLLAEEGPARPMAGISALSQLAEDSVQRTWLMTESLSAFVRYTSPGA